MSAPLKDHQKRDLARLARRAYHRTAAVARGRGEEFAISELEWRHNEVAKACGKLGLRCCSQDDYNLVLGHFLALVGQEGAAMNAFVRGATEPRRVAEYKVLEALKEFGLAIGYAEHICRMQNHGAGLQEVDDKALWRVFYTLRNRGNARKRKAA